MRNAPLEGDINEDEEQKWAVVGVDISDQRCGDLLFEFGQFWAARVLSSEADRHQTEVGAIQDCSEAADIFANGIKEIARQIISYNFKLKRN